MAKAILLDVLEKTIGKYVLNLDTNSLNVALWSGKIELHSLHLNVEATNRELSHVKPPLPFRVQSGHFGSFEVDVPWTQIMSQPVVVRAKGLHVQLCALSSTVSHADSEESKSRNHDDEEENNGLVDSSIPSRCRNLAQADQFRLQTNALRQLAQPDLESSNTFGARLVRRIVENMQIEIRDVEISFQGPHASCGCNLESMLLFTTDEKGLKTYVDRTANNKSKQNLFLYKQLKIRGLGIFLDNNNFRTASDVDDRQGGTALRPISEIEDSDDDDDYGLNHDYVLAPLSLKATLRQADSPNCDLPQYMLQSELTSLSIVLSKTQLELARQIGRQLHPQQLADPTTTTLLKPLFPEYRPLVPLVRSTARLWWKYAYRCICRLNGRRSWMDLLIAPFQKRKKYIALYKRKVYAPPLPNNTPATMTPVKLKQSTAPGTENLVSTANNNNNKWSTPTITLSADPCHWIKPLTEQEDTELEQIDLDRSISIEGIMIWRNMADAQVQREREKLKEGANNTATTTTTSLFTSLFGSSSTSSSAATSSKKKQDDPPIELSAADLIELERQAMDETRQEVANLDCQLYDIHFLLKSFRINLLTGGLNAAAPTLLALLQMETVSTEFQAHANGAYQFVFCLGSLAIHDKHTANTLFSTVLKDHNDETISADNNKAFFDFSLKRTKQGDQQLAAQLRTLEVVAAPQWIQQMRRFLDVSETFHNIRKVNPVLAQSMSGSVDLFYDADEGFDNLSPVNKSPEHVPVPSSNLSNALFDVWKERTETRSSWSLDLDLQAPILVVPASCTDPLAPVLVFDLGHLQLRYGSSSSNSKVKQWFKSNPKLFKDKEPILDQGNLLISSLSFWIGQGRDWRSLVQKHERTAGAEADDLTNALIQPISLQVELGVEASSAESLPRVCAFAMLPSVVLALTRDQLARILSVYQAWTKVVMLGATTTIADPVFSTTFQPNSDDVSLSSSAAGARSLMDQALKAAVSDQDDAQVQYPNKLKQFHVDLQLQRLSLQIGEDDVQNGMEAHLVSVGLAVTTLNDANSIVKMTMGWFWILDKFDNPFLRTQRLLAHSRLPRSGADFAVDSKYDVMSALDNLGVFQPSFAGSSDLADICLMYSPHSPIGKLDPFLEDSLSSQDIAANAVLDAKMTSLFMNWNPRAIKRILDGLAQLTNCLEGSRPPERANSVILLGAENTLKTVPLRNSEDPVDLIVSSDSRPTFLVRAQMESVELCLRSARDDLPIFTLTMSSASVSYANKPNEGTILRASLGNLSVNTPNMGQTHENYRTILGISPGKSDSLLSICYVEGETGMSYVKDDSLKDIRYISSWGLITISPMRMVYIQAQVLGLAEYGTEGILGTLTSRAAASAAVAAAEIATSGRTNKLFVVRATGFEVLLPEKANDEKHFTVKAGCLTVEYNALAKQLGSKANVSLSNVMIEDLDGLEMLDKPITMGIYAIIPREGVGTPEDQAYRVNIDMSDAAFLLLKQQYKQILSTMDKNIGDLDLHLRDDSNNVMKSCDESGESDQEEAVPANLTHAGVLFVPSLRRIYTDITMHSLSLDLLGEDAKDGIVSVKATKTVVSLIMIPREMKLSVKVSLRDLVCRDERFKSIRRNERSLLSQDSSDGIEHNFFVISYESDGNNNTTQIGLRVGSPRFVLIPDIIKDILKFVSNDAPESKSKLVNVEAKNKPIVEVTDIKVSDNSSDVCNGPSDIRSMSFSLTTGPCSVVLVDVGGASLVDQIGNKTSSKSVCTETIVLRGVLDSQATMGTRIPSGAVTGFEVQVHGESVEMYTAFGHDDSALQVLDPFNFSVYGLAKGMDAISRTVDIRVAALTPIDMCFSMRNFALMSAIIGSLSESFEETSEEGTNVDFALTAQDAFRIEQLDHTLEGDTRQLVSKNSFSSETNLLPSGNTSTVVESSETRTSKASFKMTLPLAKLTIVNDLQGLDDALIRFEVRNLVGNVLVWDGERLKPELAPYTRFDGNFNCAIVADYFDSSEGIWKDFLVRPWELTVRGGRGPNLKLPSNHPSSSLDIESFPCHVSFSEEFLMSLASANQMWYVYSMATSSLLQSVDSSSPDPYAFPSTTGSRKVKANDLRRSIAVTAARTLVTALPYALENNSGLDFEFKVLGSDGNMRSCENGSLEYFRFPPPKSKGTGGKRLYGQDVTFEKNVMIFLLGSWIEITDVDNQIGVQRRHHDVQGSIILFSEILKEGKTTVIHLSSGIDIHGNTSVPVIVRMQSGDVSELMGVCVPSSATGQSRSSFSVLSEGKFSRQSHKFGLPASNVQALRDGWKRSGNFTLALSLSPDVPMDRNFELVGSIQFQLDKRSFSSQDLRLLLSTEVICRPVAIYEGAASNIVVDSFVLQVRVAGRIVDGSHPCIDIFLEPRARIENNLPIPITVRTPMPHTYSSRSTGDGKESTHQLDPNKYMEVYTLGPSIAISVKCSDNPIGGTHTSWIRGNWVDLPLKPDFRLQEPIRCYFPFKTYSGDNTFVGGSEFFIADGKESLSLLWSLAENNREERLELINGSNLALPAATEGNVRTFFVTICNVSVDHTGEMLFGLIEQNSNPKKESTIAHQPVPLGAYKSPHHNGRISLLPSSYEPIQLIHLTMDGDVGMRRSQLFRIEDISIANGGVNSTAILWENGEPSGFFAYQNLINSYQSELHVVPEFIVYNGGKKYSVRVKQVGGVDVLVKPGKISPLRSSPQQRTAISIEWSNPSFRGGTFPLEVDKLGLRVVIVRSWDGIAIGSVAVQTVVGSLDSRLVVKLSEIRFGSFARRADLPRTNDSLLEFDFLRFRIQWSELKVTLNEGRPIVSKNKAFLETALDRIVSDQGVDLKQGQTWIEARTARAAGQSTRGRGGGDAVCSLVLRQVTVDWQRLFKEDKQRDTSRTELERWQSLERSQFSVIIHNIRITDETPNVKNPIVLDSTSNLSFFDLCIRVKGPLDAELVKVDLFDLNLAHSKGKTEQITVSTSEDFAWKLLDLGDRILAAVGEFAGVELELVWDEEHGGYKVQARESAAFAQSPQYSPPNSEKLYDIAHARVSPFILLFSFTRKPNKSRYSMAKPGPGAAVMNYFTQRLKFTIDRAELRFEAYEAPRIKGPADRIIEMISTVYLSRMKLKFVTLMTAVSFQDWKFLAARADGSDEYVDGDIVRAAGNLAGNTADYIFKSSGRKIESAFKRGSSNIGSGIENFASGMGARKFGSSVSSVVTGIGVGFGEAVVGVGVGAGKVVQGVGRGVGQVVGGVAGGATVMVKGSVKGIKAGDPNAVASSVLDGAKALGTGVGQGVSSVVVGTAGGVFSVGRGLFSGAQSVGKGVAGAVKKRGKGSGDMANSLQNH